ncbi:MAG: polysaccharide biosynthesis/export family protein, partial [bacterium]
MLQEQNEKLNLNLNGDYPINPEGFIIMPLIGEVRVKDRTIYEIRQSLEEKYSLYLQDPYVYVRPLIRITLLGAVNQPGSYRADPASS